MGVAVIITQLILSLSILVVLHELGHFIPAKIFKTKVEKFYLFFDPYFSLFKKKIGETEYGLGWLPLGGYVKIAGMIDESMDKEQMKQPPQPWEFRTKPAWQRLIIMLGGVTVNFILGFLLCGMVLFLWGESYIATENAKYGIAVTELGEELGLQDGDVILSVAERPVERVDDRILFQEIVLNSARTITVRRNDKIVELSLQDNIASHLATNENTQKEIFTLRAPFIVEEILKKTPAEDSDLKIGDQIISINGQKTPFFNDFTELVPKQAEEIQLGIMRDGKEFTIPVKTDENGKLGVQAKSLDYFYDISFKKYSFLEAIPAGFSKGYHFLASQVNAFGKMFSGEINPNESLGGFGAIAKLFPTEWDWSRFWMNTAILSLILAFMNLLPIPALDGGHVLFLLFEIVSGRKPSDKFMEYATIVGFVILISLLLYANGLDLFRFLNG